MINHYDRLGLNPTGKNEEGVSYCDTEIKAAYRKQALKYHPDHNQDPNAKDLFKNIHDSYCILLDPKQRAAFDEQLKQNPEVFISKEHLFIKIDDDQVTDQEEVIHDNNANAIVEAHRARGIDLSNLIINAEYNTEQLLKQAANNPAFAQAILNNIQLFSHLSPTQQCVLLMTIYQQLVDKKQEALFNSLLKTPAAKHFLGQLTSQQASYETALTAACAQNKSLASPFLEKMADILPSLSYKSLLALSRDFLMVARLFIEHHANHLRPTDLEFVLKSHPKHRAELFLLFGKYGQNSSALIYFGLATQLERKGISLEDDEVKKSIREIGPEAFSLARFVPPQGAFYYRVLNILIENHSIESFTRKYSFREQEEFINAFLFVLQYYGRLANTNEDIKITFINDSIIELLLNNVNYNSFSTLLKHFNFKALEQPGKNLNSWFLTQGQTSESSPWFLELLLQSKKRAYSCLSRNRTLLVALLNHPLYQSALATHATLQKRLAWLAAKLKITEEEITFTKLPESFGDCFVAARELQSYIVTDRKTLSDFKDYPQYEDYKKSLKKIDYVQFMPLYERVGFTSDLSEIETIDDKVKFETAKGFLLEAHVTDNVKNIDFYKIIDCFSRSFEANNNEMTNELLLLCQTPKISKAFLSYIFSLLKWNCFDSKLLILIDQLSKDPYFLKQCFTSGHFAEYQAIFKSESFRRNSLYGFVVFDSIDYSDRELLTIKPNREIETAQLDQHFTQLCEDFSQHLLPKYPQAPFSCFLSFTSSQVFISRLSAYENLKTYLDNIDSIASDKTNYDEILDTISALLIQTGLDDPIVDLLQSALQKQPVILAAVLTYISDDKSYALPNDLRARIDEIGSKLVLEQPLELSFFKIAERHLQKYRNSTDGHFLIEMINAHGEKMLSSVKTYSLKNKLINTEQLSSLFKKIQDGADRFSQQAVDPTQIIAQLICKFQQLVKQMPADSNQLTHSDATENYYAELSTTVKKNDLHDKQIDALLETYPSDDEGNLLSWLIELTFRGDEFAKQTIINYLSNEAIKENISHYLTKYCLKRIEQGTLSLNSIVEHLGSEHLGQILKNALTYFMQQQLLGQDTSKLMLDYLSNQLKNRALKYQDLMSYYGADIADQVLNRLYKVNGKLIDISDISELEHYFDPEEHNYVIRWLLDNCQIDAIPTQTFQLVCTKITDEHLTLKQVDERYGTENKSKLLGSKVEKTIAENPYLTSYFSQLDLPFDSIKKLCSFSPEQIELFPLYDQGIFTLDEIKAINPKSLHYQTHCAYLTHTDWSKKDEIAEGSKAIRQFYHSPYFKFLQNNMLTPIENGTKRLMNKGGIVKAKQLETAQGEIHDLIINETREAVKTKKIAQGKSFCHELNIKLIAKVDDIAERPQINNHRNLVKDIFKGIAGVLIAAPLLFIPIAFRQYRQTFFYSHTKGNLLDIKTTLKDKGDEPSLESTQLANCAKTA